MSRETWPTVLAELADLIGEEATLALARAEGGLDRVYIPQEPTPDHPWAAVLGPELWARVVSARAGERIDLPRGDHIRLKKVEILDLAEEGLTNREIARRVGTTERHVRRILGAVAGSRPDPRQTDLPF